MSKAVPQSLCRGSSDSMYTRGKRTQHRWSPRFVKHSVCDGKKVKIAAIDPDSRSRPQPQSLMECAGQVLITGTRSKRRVAYRFS